MTECPEHPGAEAVGTCARCGRFYCAQEEVRLDDKGYCGACGVRPDVDWLGKYYARFVGRRSDLVMLGGLLCAVGALAGVGLLIAAERLSNWLPGIALTLWSLCVFTLQLGRPWARYAVLAGTVLAVALLSAAAAGDAWPWVLGLTGSSGLLFTAGVFFDLRTQLYFRLAVSRERLRRHYERYESNKLATSAVRLAGLAIVVPGLNVVSLVLGIIALLRFDPAATPPVLGRRQAVLAIVISVLLSGYWLLWFL